MRNLLFLWLALWGVAHAETRTVTEQDFRDMLGAGANVKLNYRALDCRSLTFDEFVKDMRLPGVGSEVARAPDGGSATITVHRRGGPSCPSPYGRITQMPDFDLPDLHGKRVTSASLRGKPTLISFYFAKCGPCILEVGPLNQFGASRKDLNLLAVTFDEPAEARAFVQRFKLQWRVVPDARDFIDRVSVQRYPMMALFDAQGRLLGTRVGGVSDELEAATVAPALKRWVDGLLLAARQTARP